jgi:hypothetical protein
MFIACQSFTGEIENTIFSVLSDYFHCRDDYYAFYALT